MNENTVFEGKTAAVLGYITFVGLIIAYFMNSESKNEFAAFHLRQSLGLTLSYFLIMIPLSILDIPMASFGFLIVFIALWLYGIVSAFQGKRQLVPVVGSFYQSIFGGNER